MKQPEWLLAASCPSPVSWFAGNAAGLNYASAQAFSSSWMCSHLQRLLTFRQKNTGRKWPRFSLRLFCSICLIFYFSPRPASNLHYNLVFHWKIIMVAPWEMELAYAFKKLCVRECERQRAILCSWFSPFISPWLPGIELKSLGLCSKPFLTEASCWSWPMLWMSKLKFLFLMRM